MTLWEELPWKPQMFLGFSSHMCRMASEKDGQLHRSGGNEEERKQSRFSSCSPEARRLNTIMCERRSQYVTEGLRFIFYSAFSTSTRRRTSFVWTVGGFNSRDCDAPRISGIFGILLASNVCIRAVEFVMLNNGTVEHTRKRFATMKCIRKYLVTVC